MKLKNKKVLVYGLGISGKETIKFLLERGAIVFAHDDNIKVKIENVISFDIRFDFSQINFCVISPGIGDSYVVKFLKIAKIPVYSEIEFASRFIKGKIIAITGTNGKTTTTTLVGEIFKRANLKYCLCGNIGDPLISFVKNDNKDFYYITEVSSFQLEYIQKFCPFISAILNITPDHLNRHKTMQEYTQLKFSITKNQHKKHFCVLNTNLNAFKVITKATIKYFSCALSCDAHVENENICFDNEIILPINSLKLLGKKNVENALAAVAIAKCAGIDNVAIKEAIINFNGIEHRIEKVAEIGGVTYINDSKATNVDSTICALESFKENIILLLGGSEKGYDFDEIFSYKQKIKKIFTYGQTSEKILKCALRNKFCEIEKKNDLKESFEASREIAKSGDVILLSPACASFDQFNNYEHRGEFFKELVREVKEKT